jgi:hypothetical protein
VRQFAKGVYGVAVRDARPVEFAGLAVTGAAALVHRYEFAVCTRRRVVEGRVVAGVRGVPVDEHDEQQEHRHEGGADVPAGCHPCGTGERKEKIT